MPRTVVIPIPHPAQDPERIAEAALPHARAFAARTGARLLLVSAVEALPTFDPFARALRQPSAETKALLLREAEEHLARLAEQPGGEAETIVRWGNPVDEIMAVVAEQPEPVLALASHARQGVGRLLLGTVAGQLVRAVPCPVLVVRGTRPAPSEPDLANVVVPLDQSAFAEHALDVGRAALGGSDLRLHLLHVVEPFPYPGIDAGGLVAAAEAQARRYLEDVAGPLRADGREVTTDVRIGRAADAIARFAEEQGAGLVVMATHGRGGFSRLMFGSVAERLLHESPVPLLLVRPDAAAQAATPRETSADRP